MLADSTRWIQTAEAIKQLQAEWKTIGAVSRGHEKAIWERFRGACDRFFTRRQEDLKRRKEEWSTNLARKEALCEKAEALAESTDWDNAAAQLKQLQAEWKTIGPVRKTKSEVVWQRFRTACDRFFDRWIYNAEVPRVSYRTTIGQGRVTLEFEQTGSAIFDIPVTVRLVLANGQTRDVMVPVTDKQTTRSIHTDQPVREVQINRDFAALAEFEER